MVLLLGGFKGLVCLHAPLWAGSRPRVFAVDETFDYLSNPGLEMFEYVSLSEQDEVRNQPGGVRG